MVAVVVAVAEAVAAAAVVLAMAVAMVAKDAVVAVAVMVAACILGSSVGTIIFVASSGAWHITYYPQKPHGFNKNVIRSILTMRSKHVGV